MGDLDLMLSKVSFSSLYIHLLIKKEFDLCLAPKPLNLQI